MKNPKIEIIAAQLAAVLQEDGRHLQASLMRLNELRANLLKRDPAPLEEILEIIKMEQKDYALNEAKRNDLRLQAANIIGCPVEQITITKLIGFLGERTAQRLSDAKAELNTLTEKLKKEYFLTASLLTECARFNRQLVNALLGSKPGVMTYDARGSQSRPQKSSMVNFQL